MKRFTFTSISPSPWNLTIKLLLAFLIFSLSTTDAQILDQEFFKKTDGKYGGTLDIDAFDTEIILVAPLVSEKDSVQFKGSVKNEVSMKDLFTEIGGNSLYKQVDVPPLKEVLKYIKIPAFDFSVLPVIKKFSIKNDWKTQLDIQKSNNDVLFTFRHAPDEFRFSNINQSMSVLDQVSFLDELTIQISNEKDGEKSQLELGVTGQISKDKLINDIKKKDPSDIFKLRSLIEELPSMYIEGIVATNHNTSLVAIANFNKKISNELTFNDLEINLDYKSPKTMELGFDGSGLIKIDGTNLGFSLGLFGEPASASLGGRFELTSLDNKGEPQEWYKPFGIPFISFTETKGALSISGTTLLDKLSVAIEMKLGEKPPSGKTGKRIIGEINLDLDVNDPINSTYIADLENFNLLEMIEAFDHDVEIPSEMQDVLDIGVNKASINLNPKNSSAAIEGDITIFDFIDGRLKIGIDPTSGAQFAGSLKPINLKPGGIDVFAVHKKGNSNVGAGFDIDINTSDPKVKVNGEVSLFGITGSSSDIYLNKNGINVDTELTGFGKAKLSADVSKFTSKGRLKIQGSIKPTFGDITGELKKYIRNEGGAVAGEIVDFVIPQFGLKKISFNTNVDNASTSFGVKIHYNAGLLGEVKNYDFDLDLDLDFADPEKIPETIAKIVAALGEQMIYNFGDLVGMVFEKGVKLLEDGYNQAKGLAQRAAKEAERAANAAATFAKDAVDKVSGILDPKKFFPEAVSFGFSEYVRPGYRHYEITYEFKNVFDDEFQFYGEVDMFPHKANVPVGNLGEMIKELKDIDLYYEGKSNSTLLSVNEEESSSHRIKRNITKKSETKHFFIKEGEKVNLTVNAELYDKEPTIFVKDKDYAFSKTIYNIYAMSNVTTPYPIGGGTITLKAHPMMTREVLLKSIKEDSIKEFEKKLKKGGDLEAIKDTALIVAVQAKNKEVIELLSIKYSTKPTNKHLTLAFNQAFDGELVFTILQNFSSNQKPTAAHIDAAIKNNASGLASMMLDKGAKPNNQNLSLALRRRTYALARKIIKKGIKPNKMDLNQAIYDSDEKAFEIVLPYVTVDQGVFELAARNNATAIFKQLHKGREDFLTSIEPAKSAIDYNNLTILKMSLNSNIKADTVIVYAVSKNKIDAVKYLLAQGADIKQVLLKSIEGSNVGKKGPNMEMIDLLFNCEYCQTLANVADPDYLKTAVLYSRKGSHAEIVKLLLAKGANPNDYIDSKTGNTLLHIASMKGRVRPSKTGLMGEEIKRTWFYRLFARSKRDHAVMELLIQSGANVNIQNNKGCTPLHVASNKARKAKDIKLVKIMVNEKAADVNACTKKGKSVYRIADGKKVKQFLKEKGAKKKVCKK